MEKSINYKIEFAKGKLDEIAIKINKKLKAYTEKDLAKFSRTEPESILYREIFNHIKDYSLRPAKRLRASFIYYGYKLFYGKKDQDILNAAISIELIHSGLLVHDDFMDQDKLRRGRPTTHRHFESFYRKFLKKRDGPQHFGESMAINIGDILLFAGLETLSRSNFADKKRLLAINLLSKGIINTALGQSSDLNLAASDKINEKDILDLHLSKTAIYTYEIPLSIGAILAGAKGNDLDLISEFAIPGGISFQIQDDILGLFGDPEVTGKPDISDLTQGKATLLIVKALERGNPRQNKIIKVAWGKKNLSIKKADEVREIIKETGSLQYSKSASKKWAKKALQVIPLMRQKKWSTEAIDYLEGIVQFMANRSS